MKHGGALVVLGGLALGLAIGAGPAYGQQIIPFELHVNPETGLDSNLGTSSQPLASVNEALQRASDSNGGGALIINKIFVHGSSVPIAPEGFGLAPDPSAVPPVIGTEGNESFGWTAPGEPPREPFPIRMQPGVDLIGVADPVTLAKPKIIIDEVGENASYTSWTVTPPCAPFPEGGQGADVAAVIRGASNSRIQGFDIDGSKLIDKGLCKSNWPGIHAKGLTGFQIRDCDIYGWHDEVIFLADAGQRASGSIDGCTLKDAWPIHDDPSTAENEENWGHAGLWLAGGGPVSCNIIDTTFSNCHDGVEFAPVGFGVGTATFTGCRFELTENGIEVADTPTGRAVFSVDSTVFLFNHNRPDVGGTDWPPPEGSGASTAAILCRPTPEVHAVVRSCEFFHNAFSLFTSTNALSTFDLGASASDPGRNNFCMDFSLFPDIPNPPNPPIHTDPYRVAVFHRIPSVLPAVGNWWIRDNQHADSSGFMTIATSAADPSPNVPPPGPLAGEFDSLGVKFRRNYSVVTGTTIDFGSEPPPGPAPDCIPPE